MGCGMHTQIKEVTTILTCPGRNYLIVKITAEDGITGFGDATLNGRELAVQSVIDNYLAEWLVGYDSEKITDIWEMVFRGTYWRGGPVLMTALAGIDMALWDIKGKRLGVPLYSLIGGKCREKVIFYSHAHGETKDTLVQRAKELVESGCRVVRYSFDTESPYHKGVHYRQPHQDIGIKRIETANIQYAGLWDSGAYVNDLLHISEELRKALGPQVGMIHDVHSRLTPIQATAVARELESYSLMFLEDPIDPMDRKGLRILRDKSSTPIGTGELYTTMNDCELVISERLIDFIRVDISHFGGITPLLRLANFADIHGVKTAFHGPSDISPLAHAASMHVDLSVPNFGIQETFEPDEPLKEVFDLPYFAKDDSLHMMDRPGIGVGFNEEAALQYPFQKKYLPILRDETGAFHNW